MAIKLKNQIPGAQFAVFFGLTVGMFLLNMIINDIFFKDVQEVLLAKEVSPALINKFKWFQFIGTFLIFVMPSLLYGYLAHERPLQYLGVKRNARVGFFFITLLLLIAVQPLAGLIGELNQQIDFGSFARKLEDISEKALSKFLVMNSASEFFVNLLIVAVLPAIGEELFFRGSLQNILEKWTQRPFVAIFIASLCFAFFHFSFSKFMPIFLFGVVLGTLFYITRNLWYCIFFHLVNNTMALLASYYAQRSEFLKQLADNEMSFNWWIGLASLLLTLALFYYLRKKNPPQPLEQTWKRNVYEDFLNKPS